MIDMQDKIYELRQKIIKEIENIEDGVHIRFEDYDSDLLELIIFCSESSEGRFNCIDNYGNHEQSKKFALPENILQKIDFSNVPFDNFDARHIDFSNYSGVKLNPQTVFNKDLSNCTFKGVEFTGPFDGCKITGSDFSGSSGAKIDPLTLKPGKDLYGFNGNSLDYYHLIVFEINSKIFKQCFHVIDCSDCIFSDVIFTNSFTIRKKGNLFDENLKIPLYLIVDIRNSNFSGSKGAKIYPPKTFKGLKGCILKDAYIIGDVSTKSHQTSIVETNFSGAKGKTILGFDTEIKIDPQIIYKKDLTGTILNGVSFTNYFNNVILKDTNFSGSKNAHIDLKKISDKSNIKNVNFSDSVVISYNGTKAVLTEDSKLSQPILEKLNEKLNLSHETKLISQKKIEEARERAVIENKNELKKKINDLIDLLKKSEELGIDTKHLYGTIPIEKNLFLVQVGDHYEINRDIVNLSLLRFFNLSLIDFTNVLVTNIDFRHSMARINPQTVYRKDISGCIFDQDNIKFFDNFNDVIMKNTSFAECDFKPIKKKLV